MDLSAIPLPGPPVNVKKCEMKTPSVCDIPLPPMDMDASNIPLPPMDLKAPVPVSLPQVKPLENSSVQQQPVEGQETHQDASSGPLKFSLKVSSKPLSGTETPGEASGIFESSKDSKTEDPRPMPKLQALMKRSKPSQLPVGVLPSKTKLPATETKTELFLPSKETETTSAPAVTETTKTVQSLSNVPSSLGNNPQIGNSSEPKETPVSRESNFSLLQPPVGSHANSVPEPSSHSFSLPLPESSSNSLLGISAPMHLPTLTSVNPILPLPVTTIPNLMSLSVQPVQTLVATPVTAIIPDPTIVLRQPKMNMTNMQYVNPQKLRSAQMIATPLIANPALAAQSHQTIEQAARDSRKRSHSRSRSSSRSRSRSRRRSRSRHRSDQRYRGHRRHSTSSSEGSPRYSGRRFQRRSRSRKSTEDRRSKDRAYLRDRDRNRREGERRRERLSENDRITSRDTKHDKDGGSRRARSRTPKDDKKSRRRSRSNGTPPRDRQKKDSDTKRDRHVEDHGKEKDKRSRDSPKSKDRRLDKHSPSRTGRRSDNHRAKDAEPRSSQSDHISKKTVQKRESSKTVPRPIKDISKTSEVRQSKPKPQGSSTDSDSSASVSPVSPKRSKHSVPTKRTTNTKTRKESSDEDSQSNTSSSSIRSGTSPNHVESKDVCHKGATKDENGTRNTKSLSTRESELLSASLQSKNAGIGSSSEIGSLPVTPDEHGSGVILSAPSESDSMEISSDSELPGAKTTTSSANDRYLDIDPCLQVLCTPSESAPGSPLSGAAHNNETVLDVKELTSTVALGSSPIALPQSECITDTKLSSGPVQHSGELARDEPKYDLRERKAKRPKDPAMHSEGCLTPIQPNWFRTNIPTEKVFEAFVDAPKPKYVHIMDNDYSSVDVTDTSFATSRENGLPPAVLLGSAGVTTSVTHSEMRRWVCDCSPPTAEELEMGLFSCGPGCINRALNVECGSLCPAGRFCSNRQFKERFYAPTEPFYSGPGKGWGLRATEDIPRNSFIIEYVGEVINFAEFRRRVRRYEKLGHAHHYFMALESDRFIDAGTKGNWARFVNHSCEPNCATQKVLLLGYTAIIYRFNFSGVSTVEFEWASSLSRI
ncbi:unnamed protein product [Echinostoma caproni]|uniref:SET domain-containing protein n=1 Tax=Echinostoma caproni TaxID=27848 RepID=A0A3P8FAT4_9TREM|nr:unnamed protein product [Echinostoma caproni]